MAQKGRKGVRAAFVDAQTRIDRWNGPQDPDPVMPRVFEEPDGTQVEIMAGQWPGAPVDALPPGCPVVPLGVDGKTSYFVDTLGQIIAVDASEWGKKILTQIFALQPNYMLWAWPRWSEPKKGKPSQINGLAGDDAHACLVKAAAAKGLFNPTNRVRGRGAWTDAAGRLIWHSGEALWTVQGGVLKASPPGEIDGIYYPRREHTFDPWPTPVDHEDTPATEILGALRSWTWERPQLDPVIVLGGIGCMLVGGALDWRPHIYASGDKGVGKSKLNEILKAVLGRALNDVANTTAAGIYQHVGLDTLPVAIDEFEAGADNRRVVAIVELIRLASSGGRLTRGGQDHKGVEFKIRNAFFCSGIIHPPMRPQDLSRFVILSMGKIDRGRIGRPPVINAEVTGRQLLRQLMDAWPRWSEELRNWKDALATAGFAGRACDQYGTLFAMASLLIGHAGMEEAGFPIEDPQALGQMISDATIDERESQIETWRDCLERLLASTIDAWKGGEKPTIGSVLEELEDGKLALEYARERLACAGLGAKRLGERYALAVPAKGPQLLRIFAGTPYSDGGWFQSLKQAPRDVVVRDLGNGQVVKINRVSERCLLVDMAAFDAYVRGEGAAAEEE